MAQYKRSREDYYCNSVNNNEHENPPKCSCSISDAGVLLLSDLLVFSDDDDDNNAEDLQAAQDALLLDRMTSLHQEIHYCNRSMFNDSLSDAEVQCSMHSPNLWDNSILSSCIVGESALADSTCKMKDEGCHVSIEYLLHATDEELGIPPNPLSDHEATFDSHDTDSFWDGLMLPIELLTGIEMVHGIAGHFIPGHAI